MLRFLRLLLFPFSFLYGMVMAVRNLMFSIGLLKSVSFDIPVISIGNITVGGTGKTPHTEYVIRQLKEHYKLAVLSRGYGRKTRGFVEVKADSLPEECGDEPCQMKRKFPEQTVIVNENRREGIAQIIKMVGSGVVLLDDAYQHRWVAPGLSILLVDYNRPLFNDFMMPTGEMREFSSGIKRADVVIVSKCPAMLSKHEKTVFFQKLKITDRQHLFFSTFVYGQMKGVFSDLPIPVLKENNVLLLTGIANPAPLKAYLEGHGACVSSYSFPDHYQFQAKDVESIVKRFEAMDAENRCIVTTEKDGVRLKSGLNIPSTIKENLYYVPIEVDILDDKEELYQIIKNYVEEN